MLNRNEAATKRVAYTIAKIEEARAKLDEACAALSSVEGASAPYKRIRRVSIDTLDLRRDVDQFLADSDSALKLDREPRAEEEARYATDEPPEPSDALDEVVLTGEYTCKKQAFQFFETPEALAEELVAAAQIMPGMRVLEPSAGRGRIVRAILAAAPDARVFALDLDGEHYDHLFATLIPSAMLNNQKVYLSCGDFMEYVVFDDPFNRNRVLFDRVVMNPPFSKRQDTDHVTRAFGMLAPGGRLMSVVSGSAVHRIDRKGLDFRALVQRCGSYYDLPEGTFRESGTMVRASVVVLDKE